MLSSYLLLGMFGEGGGISGPVLDAPSERVIRLSRSTGFTIATQGIDPFDTINFTIDMSALLESGEQFSSVTLSVNAPSAALGFSIPSSGAYAAAEKDDSHLIVWPQIDVSKQEASTWTGQGQLCAFEVSMVTDSVPPRIWQRTVQIRVAQK